MQAEVRSASKPNCAKMFFQAGHSVLGDGKTDIKQWTDSPLEFTFSEVRGETGSAAPGLVEAACQAAAGVLRRCSHPAGLHASEGQHGHRQVWARDSMITMLGACALDDAQV